jgi:lipopolysaccharide biosynthesis glycosyltransferase
VSAYNLEMQVIRVFIGFDSKEEVAYHVLTASILRHTSMPVQFTPVALSVLKGIFHREKNPLQSTEFSFSRFLVPYLSGYEGWSIFMDCDMLVRDDIAKLWKLRDSNFAVMCVQHEHNPIGDVKFQGKVQTRYDRKNWSSVMLMNNAKCKSLTPDYVETASGLDLHRFRWLKDEEIGAIPSRWNHLVDYDPQLSLDQISNLHYTEGGPYFAPYQNCGYADEWLEEYRRTVAPLTSADFMDKY